MMTQSQLVRIQSHTVVIGLALASLPCASADEWKAILFTGGPGAFPAFGACEMTFNAGWKDVVNAGQLKLKIVPKGDSITVSATGASVGAANALLPVEGEYLVQTKAATLEPVVMEQTEKRKGQTLLASVQFSPGKIVSTETLNPGGQGGEEIVSSKEFADVPRAFDLVSAALFLRSQPLKEVGESYTLAVVAQSSPRLMTVEVVGKEKRDYKGESIDAVKVKVSAAKIKFAETEKSDPDKRIKDVFQGTLGDITGWISDDDRRLPLAVAVEIPPIGSVEATLVDFK